MLVLVKVISADFDKFKKRIVKVLRFGRNDFQNGIEASPAGVDSNPIKGMIAVYGPTNEQGKRVILGYFNKDKLAATGEVRLFATDATGILQNTVWLKANGDIEVGGNLNNFVKHAPLDTALQAQIELINIELAKIAAAINAIVPASYTPTPIQLDITASKTDKVKTL